MLLAQFLYTIVLIPFLICPVVIALMAHEETRETNPVWSVVYFVFAIIWIVFIVWLSFHIYTR